MKQGTDKVVRFYKQSELRAAEHGFREVAGVIEKDIDSLLESQKTDCKAGCAHCCELWVDVLPTEAARIVDYVRENFDAQTRTRIKERLDENRELALDCALLEDPQKAYKDAARPCAFLTDDKMCSIYPVRPFTCRGFGSKNVGVCDGSVPDDGQTTFSCRPDSMNSLIATSGLFWSNLNEACVDYWMGNPVKVEVTVAELNVVRAIREMIERRAAKGAMDALINP